MEGGGGGGGGDLGGFSPNSNFPDAAMDLDFMDELLFEGCWLETTDGFNFMQPGPSTSSGPNHLDPDSSRCLPVFGSNTFPSCANSHQMHQGETEIQVSSPPYTEIKDLSKSQSENWAAVGNDSSLSHPGSFIVEGTELGSRWWIGPRTESGSLSSVKERLMQAIGYLKESTKDRDILIQIWVPVRRDGKHVLTTEGQPYSLNKNCKSLEIFRSVSKSYNFPAEEDSKESVGLPGRVYLGKLPEWTPDVRFFRSDEYPRIRFAEKYNVGGSLALPVFERANGTCLGVVEIVTTTQKINYHPELEYVCKALEAVDLSSHKFTPSSVEACNEVYKAALCEIAEVLRSVCKTYKLPLALTWASCLNQGKSGCRHSYKDFYNCVSTVDTACFVADDKFLDFLEACSEHHLLRSQGIVGRAFTTSKRCFVTDITAFSKTNYPLSHHARMFGLRGALAIPLHSISTGSVEFVLELFLPKDCHESEAQQQMLKSLASFMQQACQSSYVVVYKELGEEVILPIKETVAASNGIFNKDETQFRISSSEENSPESSSWIAHMMEAQQKGKGVYVSWEYQKEELKEEFKVRTHWEDTQSELYNKQVLSDFGLLYQNAGTKASIEGGGDGDSSSSGVHHIFAGKKAGEKRRTKMEKTISLQVLQQYFAGSLKDAAKSIGVCPTTLKRICRQHGITRWPSRKIKKVGHSLRKLQLVIDSVQGAEGAIQIGTFYSSFPELSSPNFPCNSSSLKISNQSKPSEPKPDSSMFSQGAAALKSPSSSCSHSSGSSTCCSTGVKQHGTSISAVCSADGLTLEDPHGALKRARSDAELHALNHEEPKLLARSQSHKTFIELPSIETLPPLPKPDGQNLQPRGALRVKATFREDKIRFSLQPVWGFRDLQQEIARRFNIEDLSRIDLKYLDDDDEWVLLTCDADLEECIDIYKSSQRNTIKISLEQASHPNLGSSAGSTAPI